MRKKNLFYKNEKEDFEEERRMPPRRRKRHEEEFDQVPHHHRRRERFLNEELIDEFSLDELIRILGMEHHRISRRRFGNSQDRILKILSEEESITQKNLQKILHVMPGTISETITKMEEKNLLIREKNEDDKRGIVLRISEEGKKVSSDLEGTGANFEALNKTEKKELEKLLKKLIKSWIKLEKEEEKEEEEF